VDRETLQAYERGAAEIAARHRAITPAELHRLILSVFHPAQPTADIGCGCGRDVAWLTRHGFPAAGYDASEQMLRAAREFYPEQAFHCDSLPDLPTVPDQAFANVLCSGVLMHLPREHLASSVLTLARILKPGGRLVLSYRESRSGSEREPDGRLFTPIPPGELTVLLEAAGFRVVSTRQHDSERSHVDWNVLVAEKQSLGSR
jgi:SAM-dependent methyltransferase